MAFREALQKIVTPKDVVVDLGAGTGLLSFFAVQAGARHVYAIEMGNIAEVAAELIYANGLQDRITLIRNSSKRVTLPERGDVLVSETLSSMGFDTENTIDFMADARIRLVKEDARIIPETCKTFLAPSSSDAFGLGHLTACFYGLDFQPFRRRRFARPFKLQVCGKPLKILAPPMCCFQVDFRTDSRVPGPAVVSFPVREEGRLDGFLGWFEARLCDGVTISNSPFGPPMHWDQIYFPCIEQPLVHAGESISLRLDPNMSAGEANWLYRVSVE